MIRKGTNLSEYNPLTVSPFIVFLEGTLKTWSQTQFETKPNLGSSPNDENQPPGMITRALATTKLPIKSAGRPAVVSNITQAQSFYVLV